jgi:4-amino-4-deoxy-L-arabinose transferase-like glycosyltransferase
VFGTRQPGDGVRSRFRVRSLTLVLRSPCQTRYISNVRLLVRQSLRFFLLASLAALLLRLFFLLKFPHVTADSAMYADLARNWLLKGIYGLSSEGGRVAPSFARLPGYPGFLALVFAIFGLDHFRTAMVIQILVELGTCFVVADLARRCISDRAAKAAFLLTALCPFLAQYTAAALTETLEIFFTALAMNWAVIGLEEIALGFRWRPWLSCGASVAACILLRPDGGLLLAAIGLYLGVLVVREWHSDGRVLPLVQAGIVVAICALAPLGVWGWRNMHTLHRVQFLAPRYANEEDEFVAMGFIRWTRTWIADYVSTEEIDWNVPGDAVDPTNLPSRAFDSPEQRKMTFELFDQYNKTLHMTPELDAQFGTLAAERIRAHPLRYYVWLPLLKIADMWLRPRTELLPPDTRWYEFDDDLQWIALAVGFGIINLFYVLAAIAGLIRGRPIAWVGLGISYIVLRSLFLGTMENPEARYTLECFPAVILMASGLWRGTEVRENVPSSSH